ncbi:RNA polymerase sigma factor [Brevifollis gellanilyticus]|uniref:RNA polymerase sigma-70 region 2 domain-containing protein n=1 Tax=Brevifollis gellanilyticus TaxID=748831 RepID=A0A512MBD4_9BACT|nr:sigma-70 family RNA polymerase sigma factor [Brevifollis gellanilyticus]GEP44045.1 hypothetical protein BGE01nite_33360 [Brevifollis gellanilyticus]
MSTSRASTLTLDTFCRAHWRRLHAAACQRGCSAVEAEDSVQELFLSLARRGELEDLVTQPAERQASYLFLRMRWLLINRWRDANCLRRAGSAEFLPLDDELMPELRTHATPATEADRPWLAECISVAIDRLRQQTREKTWYEISPDLIHDESEETRTGARRVALHRARKKLRHLVREQMNGSFKDWLVLPVAKTVPDA